MSSSKDAVIQADILYPKLGLDNVVSIDKSNSKHYFFNIPITFELTLNKNYIILKMAFIIGLEFRLILTGETNEY